MENKTGIAFATIQRGFRQLIDSLSYTELSDSGVLTVSVSGLRAESANPLIELDLGEAVAVEDGWQWGDDILTDKDIAKWLNGLGQASVSDYALSMILALAKHPAMGVTRITFVC